MYTGPRYTWGMTIAAIQLVLATLETAISCIEHALSMLEDVTRQ